MWSVFLDLHNRRGNHGMGTAPIALADLTAWQTLLDVRLTPWEIDTLLHLDSAALAAQTTMDDSST